MDYEEASINSSETEIYRIFENTKTIAIIGCSPKEEKDSNRVARYLQSVGFRIVPVYPKEEQILGEDVYRSVADIPFKIDMVNIFRKAKEIDVIVDMAIKRGDIDCLWTQLGLVNNQACERAHDASIKIVQDKCTKIEHAKIV